jgi:diguanylate cyclase (GGDEF)-like protein
MRVLLIENNDDDARLIQEKLARAREPVYLEHVDRLSNGIDRLATGDIDVVLLDLGLPDSQGFDTFATIHARVPSVPIVVLTGSYADEQLALGVVREGAQDYLLKDHADGEVVFHALRYAIERKRTERALKGLNATLEERTSELQSANMSLTSVTQELRKVNEHLTHLALLDPLTGLLNRRGLQQALFQELQRGRREGSTLLALLLDLDEFKRINDTLGLTMGDQALVQITHTLRASLRATDHVARIGGDEFLVLLPGTRLAEGLLIAEKLRLAVSGTSIAFAPTSSVSVTASLGLVELSEATTSIDELLSQTQAVLQRSKNAGKDQVSVDESGAAGRAKVACDARVDLLTTLRRGEGFRALRQPICSLEDMRPVGYELLSRLGHETFAMPDDFFRASHEANLLTQVDHYCLTTCLAAAASLPPGARCHVNLFPSTIVSIPIAQLLDELEDTCRARPCCIEISEQQVLGDPSYLAQAIGALRRSGVLIAIDDVGFGRSSLESLILLQPEIVKIDKECVHGIGRDDARVRLLARLLKVIEALGAEAVAEGIESWEDLEVLQQLGAKYGQGFLLGEPS